MIRRLDRAVRERGATPIFYVVPRADNRANYLLSAQRAKATDSVLYFADYKRHRDLFDARLMMESTHYNDAGAKRFTRALARRWHLLRARQNN